MSRCAAAAWVDFRCKVKFPMSKDWDKTKASRQSLAKTVRYSGSHSASLLLSLSVTKKVTSSQSSARRT